MSELDTIYQRTILHWQQAPGDLERDQPLLARAFKDAQPNRELEDTLERKQRQWQRDLDEAHATLARTTRERNVLQEQLEALQATHHALERHASALEAEAETPELVVVPSVVFEPSESQQLAALGWRKGT